MDASTAVNCLEKEKLLSVTIDGVAHDFQEGLTILEALRRVGAGVPTLCSDDRLEPSGNTETATSRRPNIRSRQ